MKAPLCLTGLLALFVFYNNVKAQEDSLHYDLGRVLVKKSATQTTSIKGADLEKYQASNLSDAINVWLYGTYTTSANIVYVIDGNIISDVNAYSVFDIEEVTLVETALSHASGAGVGQQMVLIKTRNRRKGKQGIEVNGQSSLVNLRNNTDASGVKSTSNRFDQYYIAGYHNFNGAAVGISLDYQHDIDPALASGSFTLFEPSHYQRFKINAYTDIKLGKSTTLRVGASYIPQSNGLAYGDNAEFPAASAPKDTFSRSHITQHMMNANISLMSNITPGLVNRFSIAYNRYNYFEKDSTSASFHSPGYSTADIYQVNVVDRAHNMLVRDYITWHGGSGNMEYETSLNLTYRNFSDSLNYHVTSIYQAGGPSAYAVQSTPAYQNIHYSTFFATPSASFYYKDVFNMQGGAVTSLNTPKAVSTGEQTSHVFPFLTSSLSLSRLIGITFVKWGVYASFAKQSPILADQYSSLTGFNPISPRTIQLNALNALNPYRTYNSYQAGTAVGVTKSLSISYSHEFKSYHSTGAVSNAIASTSVAPTSSTSFYLLQRDTLHIGARAPAKIAFPLNVVFNLGLIPYNYNEQINHISLLYNVHSSNFTWNTQLSATESAIRIAGNSAMPASYSAYLSTGHRWTGGFTNRVAYRHVFAGADFLYQAGARPDLATALGAAPDYIPLSNNNSISLQNLYFGVRVRVPYLKYAELYASGRNIYQNKSSDITDERRFYGAGLKAGL